MAGLLSKAPWSSSKDHGDKHEDSKQDEQSLNTVLRTREDRTSLLLLVAECTESMRKTVLDTFDPDEVGSTPVPNVNSPDDERPDSSKSSQPEEVLELRHEDQGIALQDDETRAKAAIAEAETVDDQERKEAEAKEKARKEREAREKEVTAREMQDLKKAALAHFDNWRDGVIGRVGGAINEKDEEGNDTLTEEESLDNKPPAEKQPTEAAKDEDISQAIKHLYPAHDTPLAKLEQPQRILILHSLLLLVLSLEHYPAESRVLLLNIASSLRIPIEYLSEDESKVARGLLEVAQQQMNADEETKKKADESATARKWKVGLGAVAGAALIGVTGGLAAPFLAAGIGTVMGGLGLGATVTATYLGALAGSAPLVGALFGAYGGRMAGNLVENYSREVSDFGFVPAYKPSTMASLTPNPSAAKDRRLRVAIGISGWISEPGEFLTPWHVLKHTGTEAFALRFELEALLRLGNAITGYAKSAAWGVAKTQIIKHTVFAALTAGLWPLGIVKAAQIVDNPFTICKQRSEKAGRVLADALINKVQGERPVTLIGYSLGARVIYACLDELAKRRAFGLVESVVLAGAPVPADSAVWRRMRSAVGGRMVNVFSTNDYLLGFLYRTSSFQYGIAGLQAVQGVKGVENVDVSDLIDGHTKYRFLTGRILKKIGFEDIDEAVVEKEENQLRKLEEKEEAEQKKAQAEGKDIDTEMQEVEENVDQKKESGGIANTLSEKMQSMKVGMGMGKAEEEQSRRAESEMTEEEKLKQAAIA